MTGCCQRLRKVDIEPALALLPRTVFVDTGGTNGWIAQPAWLLLFARSLDLDGIVVHTVCRKLPPWQGIPPHVDSSHVGELRFHVPLLTHPNITMRWPEESVEEHLEAGYLYQVDFTKIHEIVHRAPVDRVHVQINVTVPHRG